MPTVYRATAFLPSTLRPTRIFTVMMLAGLLLAGILLLAPAVARGEDRPTKEEVATRVASAVADLASPVASVRRDGVDRLDALMPGAAPAVIEALETSSWSVQVQLLEVLGRGGSARVVDALLRHLVRADEAQAVQIRLTLVRDRIASSRLLAAWRSDPAGFLSRGGATKRGVKRLRELVDLLRRAEIEDKFISRKSKSGSTGYYKGQYDLLKGEGLEPDYRQHALQVVTGIAIDEAIPTPGVYRRGVYRFLRPNFVDDWEFQSMALNAVAELCTPEDRLVIEKLERRRIELLIEREKRKDEYLEARSLYDYESKEFQDAWFEWDDAMGAYLDQIAALYIVAPERYHRMVREFIGELRSRDPRPVRPYSYIAALQIRCGWYDEAIQSYNQAMYYGSKAYGYYNQACAYASWSREPDLDRFERSMRLTQAVRALQASVENGWSDVDWMNEDRDLDPLREHRKADYAAIVKTIQEKYGFDK